MFTLRTNYPVSTETLPIPKLCLTGKAPPRFEFIYGFIWLTFCVSAFKLWQALTILQLYKNKPEKDHVRLTAVNFLTEQCFIIMYSVCYVQVWPKR